MRLYALFLQKMWHIKLTLVDTAWSFLSECKNVIPYSTRKKIALLKILSPSEVLFPVENSIFIDDSSRKVRNATCSVASARSNFIVFVGELGTGIFPLETEGFAQGRE